MNVSIKIPCTLIPVKRFNLLLPNSAIAEVIVTNEIQTVPDAPPWLYGTVNWQNHNIKIILFDQIDTQDIRPEPHKSVITIIRNPVPNSKPAFLGILVRKTPQVLDANSHNLDRNLHPKNNHSCAISYATINGKDALIPNIESLVNLVDKASI